MLIVYSVKYNSYFDLCKKYHIKYSDFLNYKRCNLDLSEFELLGHFISNIVMEIDTGNCIIDKNYTIISSGIT